MKVKAMEYIPKNSNRDHDFPWSEKRWCIMDEETGEILDDAQGYGYKTPQKAYAAWGYKHRDTSKDAEKLEKTKVIKQWMKEHRSFMRDLDNEAFIIYKGSGDPNDRFDASFVSKMLKESGYTDLEFTAGELLKVMSKGSLCPEPEKRKKKKRRKAYV